MKKIYVLIGYSLYTMSLAAQSHHDYMDDSAVAGGADRALNGFLLFIIIGIALFVIILIFGGIAKIKYELSPQSKIDRQKEAKKEQERQERIRKEQEHQKALLALPPNTIRFVVEGRPHVVELARIGNRIHTEKLAICMWTVDKIIWNGTDITDKVGSKEKLIDYIYGDYYKSSWLDSPMCELIVSKHCADLANKSSATAFEIELTIRGDFDPPKLQIIHHKHDGLKHHNVSRDIKCLEFVLYDGDVIQTHLTNGEPLCFPFDGYNSYPQFK